MRRENSLVKLEDKSKGKDDEKKKADGVRAVYISGHIGDETSKDIIQNLIRLQKEDPLSPIKMLIDSHGGYVDAMFSIIDVMEAIMPEIETIALGKAMSAAAIMFVCGTKGRRFMMPHSRLMLHQVTGFTYGTTADVLIEAEEQRYLQKQGTELIASKSNLTVEEVEKMIDRDSYIRPEQAIEMGLCDGIVKTIS